MFCLFSRPCRVLRPVARLSGLRVTSQGTSSPLISFRELWKPAVFACGFTGVAFTASAIWTYENSTKRKRKGVMNRSRSKRQQFSDGQIVAGAITALNVAVFACFRVRRFQPFMSQYFLLSASRNKPKCLPMILSAFAHNDIIHLGINMFVMFSFAQSGVASLGKEQFLAVYTSAGVFASLISLVHKVVSGSVIPSVGASGAILAVFATHCLFYPESRIQIIFLPFLGTSAGYALPGIVLIDSMGVLLKWRWLDHAAHLGGALFGSLYVFEGRKLYQQYGSAVAQSWHKIRSK